MFSSVLKIRKEKEIIRVHLKTRNSFNLAHPEVENTIFSNIHIHHEQLKQIGHQTQNVQFKYIKQVDFINKFKQKAVGRSIFISAESPIQNL